MMMPPWAQGVPPPGRLRGSHAPTPSVPCSVARQRAEHRRAGAHLHLAVQLVAEAGGPGAAPRGAAAPDQLQRDHVLGHGRAKHGPAMELHKRAAGQSMVESGQLQEAGSLTERPAVPPGQLPVHPRKERRPRRPHLMLSRREAPTRVCRSDRASPCRRHVMLTPALNTAAGEGEGAGARASNGAQNQAARAWMAAAKGAGALQLHVLATKRRTRVARHHVQYLVVLLGGPLERLRGGGGQGRAGQGLR